MPKIIKHNGIFVNTQRWYESAHGKTVSPLFWTILIKFEKLVKFSKVTGAPRSGRAAYLRQLGKG